MSKGKKTALVLGGGGSRGAYEIGVWKALDQLGIKIDIVTGTSVGSINGALVAQGDLAKAEKLWQELETNMVFDIKGNDALSYAKEIVIHGGAGTTGLKKLLEKNVDEKRVRRSNIEFGLATVSIPDMKPHELMKEDIPEGELIPYIMASAACFPASKFQEIDGVKFVDGGYKDNIPVRLAQNAGAEEVIAVNLDAIGFVKQKDLKQIKNLTLIEPRWNLGNFLVFDKQNSSRIIQLGYLNTMKVMGHHEGDRYTFQKGEYDGDHMQGADEAGDYFEVEPITVYRKNEFDKSLKDKVQIYINTNEKELKQDLETFVLDCKHLKTIEEFKALASAVKKLTKDGMHNANNKMITLIIAESFKHHVDQSHSIFSKAAMKVLKPHISAASYLIKNNIY